MTKQLNIKPNGYKPAVQSPRAVALCGKIIGLHKRMVDAGLKPPRLDVSLIQVAGANRLTGIYSSLLEYARGAK